MTELLSKPIGLQNPESEKFIREVIRAFEQVKENMGTTNPDIQKLGQFIDELRSLRGWVKLTGKFKYRKRYIRRGIAMAVRGRRRVYYPGVLA